MANKTLLDDLIDGIDLQSGDVTAYLDRDTGKVVPIANEIAALSAFPLDGPLPDLERPRGGSQSTFENLTTLAKRENLTIRQLMQRAVGARAKSFTVGTPSQIADHLGLARPVRSADGVLA